MCLFVTGALPGKNRRRGLRQFHGIKRLIEGVYRVERMLKSHELLLKVRFDPRYEFQKVLVWYVDRGAPGDRSQARGNAIVSLEPYYLEIQSERGIKRIPYHRIRKIIYAGDVIWER